MEMALYYPDLGYYTSAKEKIGVDGDYYTSTSLTFVFGALIGRQIEEMWSLLGKVPFTIVEYGAGTGSMCRDILTYLKRNKRLYDELNYCIVEKNTICKKEINDFGQKVKFYNSIRDIGDVTGCILSNELLDNFAVHRVVMKDELMEVLVGYENGFVEILQPASQELKDYLQQLNVELPQGFHTEINLQVLEWAKEVATALKKGFVLTIDYGYPSSELYCDYRRMGTLMCYYKHSINDCPYNYIGEQDITTHVNFSALYYWGLKNGLDCSGFTDQFHFLHGLGFVDYLREIEKNNAKSFSDREKELLINNLLLDMGNKFKVLIQQKGIAPCQLSGLKFSKQYV